MAQVPHADVDKLQSAMLSAFDNGFSGVMILMMLMALLGAVVCAVLIRPEPAKR